jgi:serine/threonine protein kinase
MAVRTTEQYETVRMPLDQLGELLCRSREPVSQLIADQPPVHCPATLGGYELLHEVGRGSTGIVYKARQIRLNRIVALKTLLPAALESQGAIGRLQNEAEVAAQLDHPGIIPIHDIGQHNGQPYICMAFVDGESLAARLESGPIGIEAAAQIVAEVAEAIQHSHDRGIIHHDLKPANIVLDRFGQPRIADFGLARRIADRDQPVFAGISGTPAYMSPEQAAGQTSAVGPASDLYALGAILYHLLTGRPPFDGNDAVTVIQRVRDDQPPAPRSIEPSIPVALEAICLRCLEKDVVARFASAGELTRELRNFLSKMDNGKSGSSSLPNRVSRTELRSGRALHGGRRSLVGAGLLLAVLIPVSIWTTKTQDPKTVSFPNPVDHRVEPWSDSTAHADALAKTERPKTTAVKVEGVSLESAGARLVRHVETNRNDSPLPGKRRA